MTSTVLDWIARSMRMLGVLTAGRIPSGKMAADALEAANGLILSMPEVGMAPNLREVLITADYTAGEDERVVNTSGLDLTISLPETINDCCQCGKARTPRNGARVVIAGDVPITFLYLSNMGWQKVSGLDLNDPAPMGAELYTGLCALLALELAPEYDQQPSSLVMNMAGQGRSQMRWQFRKRDHCEPCCRDDYGFPQW